MSANALDPKRDAPFRNIPWKQKNRHHRLPTGLGETGKNPPTAPKPPLPPYPKHTLFTHVQFRRNFSIEGQDPPIKRHR